MRCLEKKGLLTMSSQLIGVLAASTQGDADAKKHKGDGFIFTVLELKGR
ncbi:hypothetical protein P4152_18100 [Pseudomonas aeruginosa]|nr:hypothetical protein [Pseudomonas aeruginosa]MDF5864509.1 hypothetical protein [Pseudomonas aeruginosa]MDF5903888.1 hypothetical protein [Pseudomonas aeruginosa]